MSESDGLPACPIGDSPHTDKCENDDGTATVRNGHRAHCADCGLLFEVGPTGTTIHGPQPGSAGSNPRGHADTSELSGAFYRGMAFVTLALAVLAIGAFYVGEVAAGIAFVSLGGLLTVLVEAVRIRRGRSA